MNISPKATAGSAGATAGGQIMVVVVWLLSLFHVTMPADVAVALGGLLSGLMAFAGAYAVPHVEPPPQNGAHP